MNNKTVLYTKQTRSCYWSKQDQAHLNGGSHEFISCSVYEVHMLSPWWLEQKTRWGSLINYTLPSEIGTSFMSKAAHVCPQDEVQSIRRSGDRVTKPRLCFLPPVPSSLAVETCYGPLCGFCKIIGMLHIPWWLMSSYRNRNFIINDSPYCLKILQPLLPSLLCLR